MHKKSQKCIFRFSEELTVRISSQLILFNAVVKVCKAPFILIKVSKSAQMPNPTRGNDLFLECVHFLIISVYHF